MERKYDIEEGRYGARMVLKGAWDDRYKDIMIKYGVRELYLNYAKGWKGDSIKFVEQLDFLIGFDILDFQVKDITPIQQLTNLKRLGVNTSQDFHIDYTCFPKLEDCAINWSKGTKNIQTASLLKSLFIYQFSEHNFDLIAPLHKLESLRIKVGNARDITGLRGLTGLRQLELVLFRFLPELYGIEALFKLKYLRFDTCRKVNDIRLLATLTELEELFLDNMGEIASLKPIAALKKLKKVTFIESTNIVDGDLTVLLDLPELRMISYQNRKHYTHRREYFWERFKQDHGE